MAYRTTLSLNWPVEKNSKDAQKMINEMQKRNRQTNERIEEIIRTTGKENAKYLIEKIKLHDMQEGMEELDKAKKVMENQMFEEKQAESMPEIETEQEYKEIFITPHQIKHIKDFKDYKYSHRVDKKPNRKLINDTLYSTRKDD
ncbi:hypothetical protein FQR65_LT20954 [Abscondita terminalis]|nr:hypothetical protein FQR65_LT20954 [Abscondita terminalis]